MEQVIVTVKKPWWQSKILWFNGCVAGLAALETTAHLIQPYVPGNVYGYGLMALTAGNAMLRIFSNQALSFKKPDQ